MKNEKVDLQIFLGYYVIVIPDIWKRFKRKKSSAQNMYAVG
jgi:hypothetical protein